MTIRVPYNEQKQPPAPFVLVTLAGPLGGAAIADLSAQIDTAADRTLIPLAVMQALGLEPVDDLLIGGVGGTVGMLPVYVVSLAIRSLPGQVVRVVAHPSEPWV